MSDPAPTPTPTPTAADKIHGALDGVGNWIHDQEATLAHAVASLGLSKPVADLVSTAERTFSTLPAVLAAGEKSVLDQVTPEHLQALENALVTLVGQLGAAGVKELLSRIPVALATTATVAATA